MMEMSKKYLFLHLSRECATRFERLRPSRLAFLVNHITTKTDRQSRYIPRGIHATWRRSRGAAAMGRARIDNAVPARLNSGETLSAVISKLAVSTSIIGNYCPSVNNYIIIKGKMSNIPATYLVYYYYFRFVDSIGSDCN